ncbi:MAG TPA: flavodoxin family protein [Methanoregulaceae archaeon]|nr:flavodoxin family protein [Methanoregulaceae archaeon]
MKILIVYMSYHHMNTEKIARAMAEVTGATLSKADEVDPGDLAGYDLIGFGSGIYGGKHHTSILALADEMPPMEKPVFLFSTSGGYKEEFHTPLRRKVITKGCTIINEFHCPGEATFLKFIRVNKGRPDEQDLENARIFAKGLLAAPGAEKQE